MSRRSTTDQGEICEETNTKEEIILFQNQVSRTARSNIHSGLQIPKNGKLEILMIRYFKYLQSHTIFEITKCPIFTIDTELIVSL